MAKESEQAVTTVAAAPPAKPPIWNDPAWRAIFFQIIVIASVVGFAAFLVNNTLNNLASRGISSGFDFLTKTAGFSIGEQHLGSDYSEEDPYWKTFQVGFLNTIWVAGWGVMFATVLGFVIGVLRLSSNWLVAKLATVYIETLRNIPLLLQIFFWYFAMLRPLPAPRDSVTIGESFFLNNRGLSYPEPIYDEGFNLVFWAIGIGIAVAFFVARWARKRQDATGEQFPTLLVALGLIVGLPLVVFLIMGSPLHFEYPELRGFNFQGGLTMTPEFMALLLALSAYTAAFIAEIVRAGITSVSHGQTEAAFALGLRPAQNLRLVIIPQALRVIIPPLTSQYLNLTKNSSLAAAIAYPDIVLVFAGTALMQTGQAVEIIAITMTVYLGLSLLISTLMNWYNNKMAIVER